MEKETKENVQEKEPQEIEKENQEKNQEETTTADTTTDTTTDTQQQLLESLNTLSGKLDMLNTNLMKASKNTKQQNQTENTVIGSNASYSEWMNNQLSDTISDNYISLTELDYS